MANKNDDQIFRLGRSKCTYPFNTKVEYIEERVKDHEVDGCQVQKVEYNLIFIP